MLNTFRILIIQNGILILHFVEKKTLLAYSRKKNERILAS